VKREWPADALAFEESVEASLRGRGGINLTRECEADPGRRESELRPLVESLGFGEIDFRAGEIEAAAAALGAKAAGRVVAPWPLVAQLAAPEGGIDAVHLVGGPPRRAAHLDLFETVVALDVRDGSCHRLEALGPVEPMPIDPFGVPCRLGEPAHCQADAVVGHVVLSAFYVLGAIETAVSLAATYSVERNQFERPISSFGAIQWRLADLSGAKVGLGELAAFTLARVIDGEATMADAWGLRLTMLEAAESVLANAHQVLGAIGLCEEHDVAVIDRHLQPLLTRPLSRLGTNAALAERVGEEGFDLLYPVAPRTADAAESTSAA
jgi:Acyl-CoA dehydrogenase, C-terminal domain